MLIHSHNTLETLLAVVSVILLAPQPTLAQNPTPGQLFETAFGITPSLLGTTNTPVDIRGFQSRSFSTNGWIVSFSKADNRFDNAVLHFSVSNVVSCQVAVGFAEQSQTPEQAFWTAAAHLAANSKPMFAVANDWPVTVDAQGILFSHSPPGSLSPDELIRLEHNLFVHIETRQIANCGDLLEWLVRFLQDVNSLSEVNSP